MKKLNGLGFSCYRSIGEKPVLLYPFSKINLFVGPNNSGKSNILRFIHKWCEDDKNYSDDDYPKYDKNLPAVAYRPINIEETKNLTSRNYQYYSHTIANLKRVIASDVFNYDSNNGILWFDGKMPGKETLEVFNSLFSSNLIHDFSLEYAGSASPRDKTGNIVHILNRFFEMTLRSIPKKQRCIYVKANRDLFDNSENSFLNDEKIIEKLNKTINHKASDTRAEDDKQHFEEFISDFLRYKVRVSIPASLDSINLISVDNPKEQYNLDQLGSGIHEIIYFALVATLNHDCVICIDEPEIHMHPRLQREFLEYLLKNTDNQYFIATHSSAFINTNNQDVSVFKVTKDIGGFTDCSFVSKMDELSSLVDSLGCKASDIIQSNCVIWVEGPSDRIYLNYWIHGIKPKLVEGIDYSIMFYGGRLLKHLTGDAEKVDEDFINLLKINKNSFVVIDSDKKEEGAVVNPTKQRIQEEFGNRCWVTAGREIENYLDHKQYEAVASELDSSFVVKSGVFKNLLAKGPNDSLNKVDFAKMIEEKYPEPCYATLDLDVRIKELVKFIEDSNK